MCVCVMYIYVQSRTHTLSGVAKKKQFFGSETVYTAIYF